MIYCFLHGVNDVVDGHFRGLETWMWGSLRGVKLAGRKGQWPILRRAADETMQSIVLAANDDRAVEDVTNLIYPDLVPIYCDRVQTDNINRQGYVWVPRKVTGVTTLDGILFDDETTRDYLATNRARDEGPFREVHHRAA